jgi:hypothetical protein
MQAVGQEMGSNGFFHPMGKPAKYLLASLSSRASTLNDWNKKKERLLSFPPSIPPSPSYC